MSPDEIAAERNLAKLFPGMAALITDVVLRLLPEAGMDGPDGPGAPFYEALSQFMRNWTENK